MSEDMNLSVNGQSQVPPGFRFHPTEEELLHYYLRKKVAYEKIDLDVIRDVDLNKLEPWDIQEKCKIGSTPQNDWYFFSHKDKKYPTGTRTNRATAAGFWKATGRDKVIYSSFRRIGMRKTLVFYKGRAPHGQKSDWIMHEYRLEENTPVHDTMASNSLGESMPEDGWVVCRVFRKKNYQKTLESPKSTSNSMDSRTQMLNSSNDGVLDQILSYMGRTCKQENEAISNGLQERFMHLPRLESPTLPSLPNNSSHFDQERGCNTTPVHDPKAGLNDWVAFDRLVASQLNGQVDTKQLSCFSTDPNMGFCLSPDHDVELSHLRSSRPNPNPQNYNSEMDLWNFTRSSSSSSSDPLGHLSV
ncbi:unnamed protein product, partial [Vitis vinifera]